MKRLSVRLFLSHLAVALVGGLVTFVLVRLLVPRLYDEAAHGMGLGRGGGPGGPGGAGTGGQGMGLGGELRELIATAVDQSLLIGVIAGAIAAVLIGLFASWRLLKPLREMQQATRAIGRR